MDQLTNSDGLDFSDLEGQTLTKQPGELNGCAFAAQTAVFGVMLRRCSRKSLLGPVTRR